MRSKTTHEGLKTIDSAMNKGKSQLHINKLNSAKKQELLKDPETKQATMDFIFGNSDKNPMKDANEETKARQKALNAKTYNIQITGVYSDDIDGSTQETDEEIEEQETDENEKDSEESEDK